MKRIESVTKVNVICLTDGEANPLSYVNRIPDDAIYRQLSINIPTFVTLEEKYFLLSDPKTGYTRKI